MIKKMFFVFSILLIAVSCSIFQKDTFQGTWNITVTGDFSDSFDFVVDEKDSFSFSRNINTQGGSYEARFSGKISEDGTMFCDVNVMSMKVAQFDGKMNYENGSGKWAGAGMSGSWSAVKK